MQNNKPRWRSKLRAESTHTYKPVPLRSETDAERLWRQAYNLRPSHFKYTGLSEINGKKLPKINNEKAALRVLVVGSHFLASLDYMRRTRLSNGRLNELLENSDINKSLAHVWRLSNGHKLSIVKTMIKATKRQAIKEHELSLIVFQRAVYISERLDKGKKISKVDRAWLKLIMDKF